MQVLDLPTQAESSGEGPEADLDPKGGAACTDVPSSVGGVQGMSSHSNQCVKRANSAASRGGERTECGSERGRDVSTSPEA